MSNPIQDAVAAARAAAAETAANLPSTVPNNGGASAPALVTAGGPPRSLTDVLNSASLSVENYLKVDYFGIRLNEEDSHRAGLLFDVRLGDSKAGWVIRVNQQSGASYFTSYDGVQESKSRKPWGQVLAEAIKVDPKSYSSDLIELPMELVNDQTLKNGTEVEAGAMTGASLSHMNSKEFLIWLPKVMKELIAEGKDPLAEQLRVRVTFKPKTKGTSKYGVFVFNRVADDETNDVEPVEAPVSTGRGKKAA